MDITIKIKDISCIILAGGKSSRMGEDKSLIPFLENKSLIKYQYDRLSTIFSDIYISSKTNKFDFPCKIIYDKKQEESSPMIALDAICKTIKSEIFFVITVDTPFVLFDTIQELINEAIDQKNQIVICEDHEKIHPLIGVYSKSIGKNIEKLLHSNNHRIKSLLKEVGDYKKIFFEDKKQFFNLNTPEDLKIAFL